MDISEMFDLEKVRRLLLDMAQQRSLDVLLDKMCECLCTQPCVAAVRVWMIKHVETGVRCEECVPDEGKCLRLIRDRHAAGLDSGLAEKSGFEEACRIIRDKLEFYTGEFPDEKQEAGSGVSGFIGVPMMYQGEQLGVIAIFMNCQTADEAALWLRMIADHAAASVANMRAFEEIQRLKNRLARENERLRDELETDCVIVGHSEAVKANLRQIELVAPTDASVLITGESGTGKELIAVEIHRRSNRREAPLVRVNCAAIPRDLYESEFFGHVKGAFTGAVKDRPGRFEAADGGTLFLDEIGDMPMEMQSKLLRVLQEGAYERVGEEQTRKVDVRIICASNRDLKAASLERRFRQDLYYRINVFPITAAPLRERLEDIPDLAEHFIAIAARRMHKTLPRLTQANIIALQGYDWPGNIRELQNVIERAVIMSQDNMLAFDLPQSSPATAEHKKSLSADATGRTTPGKERVFTESEMLEMQKANIHAALEKCHGRIYGQFGAANLLGIKPTTLCARIKKHGLTLLNRE